MYTLDEKLAIIQSSNSMLDLNKDVLPPAHKEDYYFVSYSHKDYKKVIADILLLEDAGINIWYDSDMHIGENWEEIAEMYISKYQCKGIIFYLSENSILSAACNKEVEYVLENNKQFFSINIPSEDSGTVISGLAMANELKNRGENISSRLITNFEKAFSDKMLYLSYSDSIQRKKEQIQKLVGEDLFLFRHEYLPSIGNSAKLSECRDNALTRLRLKNNYQINDTSDMEFGKMLPLKYIDKCAFANSYKLTEVVLPDKLYQIDDFAFANCYKLKNINLTSPQLTYITDYAFSKCKSLEINDISCNFIYKFAFSDCISLKELNLWTNQLGSFAFRSCTGLESVTFMKEPIELGSYAFEYCSNLKQVGMKDSPNEIVVKKENMIIKDDCFAYCDGLTELTLSGKIDFASSTGVFSYCKGLKKVKFNLSKKLLKLNKNTFCFCKNLTEVSGIDSVKIFEEDCFYECNNLEKVNLENAVEIQHRAFACVPLKEVYLPNVKKIEKQAFAATDTLTKVVIGKKLKNIAEYAFYGLDYLKEIEIQSKSFKYDVECFMYVKPQILTLSNVKFLFDYIKFNGVQDLKTIYVESGLVKSEQLNALGMAIITQTQSDKEGYDKFVVGRENKYGAHINNVIIIYFNNGEMDYVLCEDAGFDEDKSEYYIVANGKKYYESEIQSISKTYSL